MFGQRMRPTPRPWGVSTIRDIYSSGVHVEKSDDSWPLAVAMRYPHTIKSRIQAAWWVLTGRAEAMTWPAPGDLESAIGRSTTVGAKRRKP